MVSILIIYTIIWFWQPVKWSYFIIDVGFKTTPLLIDDISASIIGTAAVS